MRTTTIHREATIPITGATASLLPIMEVIIIPILIGIEAGLGTGGGRVRDCRSITVRARGA